MRQGTRAVGRLLHERLQRQVRHESMEDNHDGNVESVARMP